MNVTTMFANATASQLNDCGGAVIITVGSIEQHGGHLPVGTDSIIATSVCRAVADEVRSQGHTLLEGPMVWVGSSHHHLGRGGTISVSSTTLRLYLHEICSTLHRSGFRRLVLLNGHGGNEDLVRQVAKDATVELSGFRCLALSYWSLSMPELLELAQSAGVLHVPGHAGGFETALVRAIDPALIDAESFPQPEEAAKRAAQVSSWTPGAERHGWVEEIGGYSDDPRTGTLTLGESALAVVTRDLSQRIQMFLEESDE